MTSPNQPSNRPLQEIAYQFLLGALLGLSLTLVPLAIVQPVVTPWNMAVVGLFMFICGALAARWGKKSLNALVRFLESLPPVA